MIKTTIRIIALVGVFSLALAGSAVGQSDFCPAPACGPNGANQECNAVFTSVMLQSITVMQASSGAGVVCAISQAGATMVTFAAARPIASAAPPAACAWTGAFATTGAATGTWQCTIDATDGLPVELLEFSVDGDGGVNKSSLRSTPKLRLEDSKK
jgi:hypothetical protein